MTEDYVFIKRVREQGKRGERQLSVGIPNEIAEKYNIQDGDYVIIQESEKGIVIRKIENPEKMMLEIDLGELKEVMEVEPFSLKELNLSYSSDFKIPRKKK